MSVSPSPPPAAAPAADLTSQKELHYQVFGGEDSDLSDSDEDVPAVQKRKAFPARPDENDDDEDEGEGARPPASDDDDDEDEGEREIDEAYVPGSASAVAKIPKFKKRSAEDVEMDGEEDEGDDVIQERRSKKKKTKKHRGEKKGRGDVQEDEDDAPAVDEATQRRLAIEARIDGIGKKPKTTRKKKDETDVVDTYHDEICARLRERMMLAVDKDRQSNENKMPATAKLAMLDEVMSVLRNSTLWTSVVDNGVLEAVRAWLEPMEATAALPAVGIQTALFEVLPKMDLDTATLKESRLGPIVLFYSKTKRVTPVIHRAADNLVQTWSRPIVKRPAAEFRSRHEDGEGGTQGTGSQSQSQSQGAAGTAGGSTQRRRRFDTSIAIQENKGRKGARMPQVKETQYTVTPDSRVVHHEEDMAQVRKIAADNKKFNKFARQMRMSKR